MAKLPILLLFVLFTFIISSNIPVSSQNTSKVDILRLSDLVDSEPIEILQDLDFFTLGFEGTGTSENPYLIKNLIIEDSGKPLILIINTTVHFQILNNKLNGISESSIGIQLINVENGLIEGNDIENQDTAIIVDNTDSFLITKNVIQNSKITAIKLSNSKMNTISLNKITGNSIGILMTEASSNTIVNNHFENNLGFGIDFGPSSEGNTVVWNNFISNNEIEETQASDNGINNIFTSNYWNEWISPDEDNNGVVDLPYQLLGIASNVDPFPKLELNEIGRLSSSSSTDPNNTGFVIGGIIVGLILLSGFFLRKIIFGLRKKHLKMITTKVTVNMIGYSSPVLISLINSSEDHRIQLEETFPNELLNYKFILNPVRLAILKILFENSKYPSYQVRETLGVSWGSFGSHVEVLIKKGLIVSQEEFIKGSPKQVLFIELEGTRIYLELQDLLMKLFDMPTKIT